jgi:hypothetical protein
MLYEQETYKIIGACMKVHRILGAGFLESVGLIVNFGAPSLQYKRCINTLHNP